MLTFSSIHLDCVSTGEEGGGEGGRGGGARIAGAVGVKGTLQLECLSGIPIKRKVIRSSRLSQLP